MIDNPSISIIVPVLNEEGSLEIFYRETSNALKGFSEWEIIFIDDGCDDEGSCCLRFCSYTINFFMSSSNTLASINPLLSSKIDWYFYKNYISYSFII